MTEAQREIVYRGACVPEHLPHYVEPVSGAAAHLHEGYLVFTRKSLLIFIGYPVAASAAPVGRAYKTACRRFRPEVLSVLAQDLSFLKPASRSMVSDEYFRLELPCPSPPPDRAYMIKRAAREVSVGEGGWGPEHEKLVSDFIGLPGIAADYTRIFSGIPAYLASAPAALLLEARKGSALSAFTVADFGSADYAFYLFNFRSQTDFVPGANDLLVWEMIKAAGDRKKKAVNLGLGINEGNRRFKRKWGGVSFLKHVSAIVDAPADPWRIIDSMLQHMAGRPREK